MGNRNIPKNDFNEIELPNDLFFNNNLIDEAFGNCLTNRNYDGRKQHFILELLNKEVSIMNAEVIDRLKGDYKFYRSYFHVEDKTGRIN